MKLISSSVLDVFAATPKAKVPNRGLDEPTGKGSSPNGGPVHTVSPLIDSCGVDALENKAFTSSKNKIWTNSIQEENIAALNAMCVSAPKTGEELNAKIRHLAKNVFSQGLSFALFYASGQSLRYLGIESTQFGQIGAVALGDLLNQQKRTLEDLFFDKIFGSGEDHLKVLGTDTRSSIVAVHKKLVAKDRESSPLFSDDVKHALQLMYKNFMQGYSAEPETLRGLLVLREGWLKAIPKTIVDVSHQSASGSLFERSLIDASVKSLIERYPGDMRVGLRTFVSRIRANCFKEDAQFAGAYLFGKPGTGKTYFARALAEALGLPMYEFSLQDASEEDFFGTGGYSRANSSKASASVEEKAIGLLAASVIKSGILNPIVFLDEGGDSLTNRTSVSLLKKMLDPENQKRRLWALGGATLDLSRVTFMLSGNNSLDDPALKRRIKEIEFSSLPIDAKKKVILEEIDKRVENHKNLSPDIFSQFEKLVRGSFDEIVRQDFKLKSPGVGVAQQVIEDVVNYVTDVLLSVEAVDVAELNQVIEEGFKQRLPKE